jgi:transcription initiation factor TFIIIB Brf1 subunit/transcription initiation factor TFIIB
MTIIKSNEIEKMIETLISDEDENVMVKVISNKIISDLDKNGYFNSLSKNVHIKREIICGGIIYLAYIKAGNPKLIEDVGDIIKIDYERREINNEIKNIKKALGMKYCNEQTIMGTACITLTTPENYFIDLCKKENAPQNVIDIGNKIIEKIKLDTSFQSCNPAFMSGAVFYVACISEGIRITQRSIADKINANEVTIRVLFKKILEIDKDLKERFLKETKNWKENGRI